jgi:hypothetical protein
MLSPAGITEEVPPASREMTAEGHNLSAAETELNVGVAGIVKSSPTLTSEIEAAVEKSYGLLSKEIEAIKNEVAALQQVD